MGLGRKGRARPGRAGESGQATLEYLLLLLIVVGSYGIILQWIQKAKLADLLAAPLTDTFAKVYKYGHPKAKGYDEGTPENHPRAVMNGNTRSYINPRSTN